MQQKTTPIDKYVDISYKSVTQDAAKEMSIHST